MAAATDSLASVDAMSELLSYLVRERQRLRSHDATAPELEANRQAIISMQWRLNRALGAAHVREAALTH
jgi:hypothetical protein